MALSSHGFTSTILCISLLVLTIANSSSAHAVVTDEKIMEICSKVEHSSQFCIHLLSSHPETKTMDLFGLAQMVVDTACAKLQEIIAMTKSLDMSTKDHVLKARFSSCTIYFAIAANAMQVSKTCLSSKKFSNIDLSLTSAKINVVNCRDNRMGGGTIPPNLAQKIQEFDCICQTGEAITRRLGVKI